MFDRFEITPFSILDTRSKDWQQRKRWWINKYNIQSELGREDTKSSVSLWNDNSVSIFDATLCEVIYNWYLPESGGSILDPFAGGSVRGIVASELGHDYTGIDLNKSQIEANRLQSKKPNWIHGDSNIILDNIPDNSYDLVFTCPPYHDLEIYTDDPMDLSNMNYDDFLKSYSSIISKSFSKLKDNRFFIIVVSEIRDLASLNKTTDFIFTDLHDLDICDFNALNNFITEQKITGVINCAAYTNVDKAEENSEIVKKVNSEGVSNLVNALKPVNGKLIHISTDYVYHSETINRPYREDDVTNPQCVYAATKLEGDLIATNIL